MTKSLPLTQSTFSTASLIVCILALLLVGCKPGHTPPAPGEDQAIDVSSPAPLSVLIIDAPEVGAQIKRQWRARRDGELTISNLTSEQWSDSEFSIDTDVVLYPPGELANLVSLDRILVVPDYIWEADVVARRDILKRFRQVSAEYDDQVWAIPLAGPQWMLMYRSDLLEQAKMEAPRTWSEWDESIVKLRAADLSVPSADRVVLPLAENWAAHVFLLRCAASIRQQGKLSTVFDRSNMKPLIEKAPFVQALNDLKDSFGDRDNLVTPAEAWKRLLDGKCVMTIAWPMSIESPEPSDSTDIGEHISVTSVPGSNRWYDLQAGKWFERVSAEDQRSVEYLGFGGLVGSVSSDSRHTSSAFEFLEWLCSKTINATVMTGSQQSGPFRRSQLKSIERWTGFHLPPQTSESVADLIKLTHSQPVVLIFPRVPGYYDYLKSLDRHVRTCLEENSSAEAALKSVAQEWEIITDKIGRTEQTANLRRVNGL